MILAAGDDRAALDALIATDPFVIGEVCAYRITEFVAARTAPGLTEYRERPPGGPRTNAAVPVPTGE